MFVDSFVGFVSRDRVTDSFDVFLFLYCFGTLLQGNVRRK